MRESLCLRVGFGRGREGSRWKRHSVPALIRFLLCASFALCASSLMAQITSTIQGKITDPQGLVLPGVEVRVRNTATGAEWTTTTNAEGFYRVTALPAGIYTLTASLQGFATRTYENLEVTLNRTLAYDVSLEVGEIEETVTVSAEVPLLEPTTSNMGSTITPRQIVEMPLNGRNYLDLMQLVPGVAINRRADEGTDLATPVLGERAGNTIFLIDGMSNRDEFGGGAAAQFNQDTIQEFEVLTTGFKAEFGHGSGGIVNVITKSGTNEWHGSAFLFHRNFALDRNNSLDPNVTDAPFLLRWDYGVTLGGPVVKDKIFFFGSAERIRENRQLNFAFPPRTPQVLRDSESRFNERTRTFDTRLFAKLDEQLGRHHLTQEANVTNSHLTDFLPLTAGTNLPSTRSDLDRRTAMLGFRDTVLLGDVSDPFVLNLYFQFRDEPSQSRPSHPEAGPATRWALFSRLDTGTLFGDLGFVTFGAQETPGQIDQEYTSFGANLAKTVGRHGLKFGVDFQRTKVDGVEAQLVFNQLFATEANFLRFGPVFSGLFTLATTGGVTPEDNLLRLRNNYVGPYVQDDWRIHPNLTLNLGLRWDYDSEFPDKNNFSPRLGAAWSVTPKTVVRGSFGLFYDHFRLGLVRRVPAFGGANFSRIQPISYPQLFYNLTTTVPALFGFCVDPFRTRAQIPSGTTCPLQGFTSLPLLGVDHLNNLGPRPIPPETVVTRDNVQSLSGLTPDQFLAAVNAAARLPGGLRWFWGPFGVLSHPFLGGPQTVTLDPAFKTPFTRSFNIGVQREITKDLVVAVDYVHKEIKNLLGVRNTLIPFEARLPGRQRQTFRHGFGPWFEGEFDGLIISVNKGFSRRFNLAASYTFADAEDNLLNPNLAGTAVFSFPTDSFVGVPPVVCDARATGDPNACDPTDPTNEKGPFTASNGNFVPQAGVFFNGPDRDRGKSDLALDHTFFIHGLVELPWGFQISGIFRAQSGFPFSRLAGRLIDPDGDQAFSLRDLSVPRNSFKAPPFVNMDLRATKRFIVAERVRVTALIEFFNLFNRRNPAAVETFPGRPTPFGKALQVLPGMETQVGFKIEF